MAVEHWVARIATNTCRDGLRARRRRPEVRWADLPEAQTDALAAALHAPEQTEPDFKPEEARALLETLMEVLTPAERIAFSLHHLEHRPLAEVRTMTGQNGVALRVRLHRARGKLRTPCANLITHCHEKL